MPQTPLARAVALTSLVLILVIGGAVGWHLLQQRHHAAPTASASGGTAAIGGPFRLTDQFGAIRTDADFRGKLMLVFFGFTNCPDVCPMEAQIMSRAVEALGADGERVVPIFITVDPQRDTVAQMHAFAAGFHPRLVALTGTEDEIAAAAKAYRVYYARRSGSAGSDYQVAHSTMVFLMGTDGRYLTHFDVGTSATAMAEGIKAHL